MGVFGAALVPAGAGEQLKRSERRVDSSHAGGGELTGIDLAQRTRGLYRSRLWRDNRLHGCNEA